MKARRILIAPVEITGQYRNLALALREQGRSCEYYTFYSHAFQYGTDIGGNQIPALMRRIHAYGKAGTPYVRFLSVLVFEILRFIFFLQAISRYDAFIFGYGLSLLRFNHDLFWLGLLKKIIVANMSHGSDMTPDYLDGALLSGDGVMPSAAKLIKLTKSKVKTVRKFEKYASALIGSPLSSSYLAAKPFVSIFSVGRVCQALMPEQKRPVNAPVFANQPFRLLHVPSHAPGKGTAEIEKVIINLKRKGFNIIYHCLSGVPNAQVLKAIKECDLVVDQLYADLPMSGLACEAAFLGKPTILCGYELTALKSLVPSKRFPPTLICHPRNLEKEIEALISEPTRLYSQGQQLSHFVTTVWNPAAVARRYLVLIDNEPIPGGWVHDPRVLVNQCGYGLSSARAMNNLQQIIGLYGIRGLCLAHRPDLEQAFSQLLKHD